MDIHSAIKFGTKSNVKAPQEMPKAPQSPPPKHDNQEVWQRADEQASMPTNPTPQGQVSKLPPATPTHQTPPPKSVQVLDEPILSVSPAFKAVNLNIAGTTHRINCPVEEVAQLEKAGDFINDKIREIRHDTKGKNLSNEELLVLICLELYDGQESLRVERRNQLSDNERARALIEKINENARSVL